MQHSRLAPLDFSGIFALCAILVVFFSSTPLRAQPADEPALPLLFDSRERLAKPDLSSIVRLRFLTSVDFPPFNFTDQTGKLAGFHIDLAREICSELDIAEKCQIQALPFADLESALAASQGDAVIAGVAVTPELRKNFAFSRAFLMLPARFVLNSKAPAATTAASLAGRPVGVVGNTVHETMLKTFFPAVKPVSFEDRNDMLTALKEGRVDAAFADGLQLSFWVSSPASEKCCTLFDGPYMSERFLGEGMTIMLRQKDDVLTAAIDHALAALSRNGRLQEIYLRYFPNGLY
ncbi:transporter substrate-binding domain-containing protein [Rhizobium sp. BK251]|uniref:transporter substrate-binding domain-containing protein n=1 Tax=Rhizobium sp. BK251 TaxID=2512125 RepID=UPI001052B242|nr:transporter substrate-binding domain-containing protein [Rhizobium sp. BK251]TCL75512.1 amino acid ABC transporter substrate-binding protein (PAAT family) [Rhizobium sp. BK251]